VSICFFGVFPDLVIILCSVGFQVGDYVFPCQFLCIREKYCFLYMVTVEYGVDGIIEKFHTIRS
jgi:hypothetical protein